MSFEKKLQSLRKASNLNQEELAEYLGVSRQAVSKWESGVSYPEMDKLILMTKIFNCTLDDLVNDDVDDASIMKQAPSKSQSYIDSLLEFITKTINMFTSMKFISILKCIIELIAVAIILYIITGGLYMIAKNIVYAIVPFEYGSTVYAIFYFVGSIFLFLLVALDVVIFFQFYKIRYLDYYDKLIYQYQQEKNDKIKREATEALEEDKEKKKEINKEKRETIIIRDPDHRPLAFLSAISNAIILMVKTFVLFFSFPFVFSLICLIIGIVLAIYLIFTNFVFFGVTLALIGAIIINIELLLILYDFIFSKRVFIKWIFITFIASIFVSSIGIGLSFISLKNIDFIEVNQEKTKTINETVPYNDELYFDVTHYASEIVYTVDNNLKDNVKIEANYNGFNYDVDLELNNNVGRLVYIDSYNSSSKELIDRFLKNLKNNRIEIYYQDSLETIKITSSEENIKNLLKNLSKEENIKISKNKVNGQINYYVHPLGHEDVGTRVCEVNDFYYRCVNVLVDYDIEPNFKYEYKNGLLVYDDVKYKCSYSKEDRLYSCSIRYED